MGTKMACYALTGVAPVTDFAGYPANLKDGYRLTGKGQVPDIRPDF
jgi:hypothetical protein